VGRAIQDVVTSANALAACYRAVMHDDLGERFAQNIRGLRQARGLSQQQMAKLSGLPRATWSHLESGSGNPTLAVLHRVAKALQVPLEELISTPRAEAKLHLKGTLRSRRRGSVTVTSLLPDEIPGTTIERIEIPSGGRMIGVPHTPGTREYLSCESGEIELVAAGETYRLTEGDVVVFRGDQRHSYGNPGRRVAVGFSVVLFVPV
jgi:transcriptional regulator with XRE-family HTH domain